MFYYVAFLLLYLLSLLKCIGYIRYLWPGHRGGAWGNIVLLTVLTLFTLGMGIGTLMAF